MAVTIGAALVVVGGPAAAAPIKSTPKTLADGTIIVKVKNWRNADLVDLEATKIGSATWKKVLGALKAGQMDRAKVPQVNNCRVDLRGRYSDGKSADVSNFDVCADKTVDLVN